MKRGKWQQRQRRAAEALLGTRITGWTAVEMAIVEVGPDGSPLFEVAGIECLQLWRIELETADGLKAITTYQNNDLWGLQVESAAQRSVHEVDGISVAVIRESLPMRLAGLPSPPRAGE